MHSKFLWIFFHQKEAPVKEDLLNNLLSMKKAMHINVWLVIVKKSSPKNLSDDCRSTVGRQVTDSLPTANQQVTDRLRKKKNCVKNEQLTWHNNP